MLRASLNAALLAVMLTGTASAVRVVDQPEGAYEIRLGAIALPRGSDAGYVVFRPCSACDRLSLSIGDETTYSVEGTIVTFVAFVRAAEAFRGIESGGGDTAVYVFYDLASRRVNRLALDHFKR